MKRMLVLALFFSTPLAAQSGVTRAAETITPGDVGRRIGVIAHDSMMGRDTPSRGLDLTAQYVANEFKRFGLKPAGDSGGYIQHYPLVRQKLDAANSTILFRGETEVPVSFAEDALILFGSTPAEPVIGEMVLLGGVVDPEQIPADAVKDRVVIWPLDFSKPIPGTAGQVLNKLVASGAKFLVVISNRDSASFATELGRRLVESVSLGSEASEGGPLVIEVNERAIIALVPQAAEQFAQLRGAPSTVVQPIPEWSAELVLKQNVLGTTMVPNTIGILEGSDPRLKSEYLVYSAHMDHIGINPGQPDSISNGADDDASGTAGVIELAQAFAERGARPKRSILFITVSGEEKGLWGSSWFADHPTVPLKDVVANLNIDMIGRNWKDTVVAIGMQHSDLGTTLSRVSGAHADLKMTAIDDPWPEENLYFRSDHYNFARKGVPVLFFTSGLHDDYHQVTDSPEKIDNEKEARLLQLLYFLGQDIANNPTRPQWNPDSYKQIVEPAESTP
jgi:Peptidase family M28